MAVSHIVIELEPMNGASVAESTRTRTTERTSKQVTVDHSAVNLMEWMEENYKELLDALRSADCVTAFQLAEANQKTFSSDEAVRVAKAMSKYLKGDEEQRKCYVKSLFMCLSPLSLVSLAVELYRVYSELCPDQLTLLTTDHYDEPKVTLLGVELYVRGMLNEPEQAVSFKARLLDQFKKRAMEQFSNDWAETQLRDALLASETIISFFLAFNYFKEFPQEDAARIAKVLASYLEEEDEEKEREYRDILISVMGYGLETLPVAIALYLQYKEKLPDKVEVLFDDQDNAYSLGKALRSRQLLGKGEEHIFFDQEAKVERDQSVEEDLEGADQNDLLEALKAMDLSWAYYLDILTYNDAQQLAKIMEKSCLEDEEKRECYMSACSGCHESSATLSVVLTQRYLQTCPDTIEEFCGHSEQVASIGREMVKRNLLSDRMQEIILRHTTFSPNVEWLSWGDLTEVMPETSFRAILPLIAHVVGDFSTFPLGEVAEESDVPKIHLPRRLAEAAILVEGGSLTSARAVARGDKVPEHKLRKACTSVLLKISSESVCESGVLFVLDELLKFQPYTLKMNTEEKCVLELVGAKGLSYTDIVVKLFENGCEQCDVLKPLVRLMERKNLEDYILRAIVSSQKQLDASGCLLLVHNAAFFGFASTTVEATKLCPLSSEEIFKKVLEVADNEQIVLDVYDELNPNLFSDKCVYSGGNNPSHKAAEKGYTAFCKQIIAKGYERLLNIKNHESQYPVQICLSLKKYATAGVMLKSMEDWKLCVSEDSKPPEVNCKKLIKLLAEMKDETESSGLPWSRKPKPDAAYERLTQDIEDCITAVLDATVDEENGVIHHEVLEVDEDGLTPDKSTSTVPSTLEIIAKSELEGIAAHDSFRILVKEKWKLYGWKFYLVPLVSFVVFLLFLTTALVLATKKANPATYHEPLDWFRLFCEIVVFLVIGYDCFLESVDFWNNYDKSPIKYFSDYSNILNIFAVLVTVLIVPFRFANLEFQWVFAAIAYILHSLRIFEYAVIMAFVGTYVNILIRVIIHDTLQFLIVLGVIIISFGGGLFFSLHGEPCSITPSVPNSGQSFNPIINTSHCLNPDETSEIYLTWLTGIRLLVEGSVIEPYIFGEEGLRWLGVIIYFLFVFVVSVILLNLLIAQFSKTYEEELDRARVSVTLERARILIKQQSFLWIRLIFWFIRKKGSKLNSKNSFSIFYRASSPFIKIDESDEVSQQFEEMKDTLGATNKSVNKSLAESKDTLLKVRDDLDEVKGELKCQAEVISELQTALKEQTRLAAEQQRAFMEMCNSMKEMLREGLRK